MLPSTLSKRGFCFIRNYPQSAPSCSRFTLRCTHVAQRRCLQNSAISNGNLHSRLHRIQLPRFSNVRESSSQAEPNVLTTKSGAVLRYFQVVAKELKYVETSLEQSKDPRTTRELTERLKQLSAVVGLFHRISELRKELDGLKDLEKEFSASNDQEMLRMAIEDQRKCESDIHELETEVFGLIVPPDPEDCHEILLEVTAGIGGKEAMLFTKEIFTMYHKFASWKGWQCKPVDYQTEGVGGLRHGSLNIIGSNVGRCFKFESGVHRVQRIPQTERSGRIHTSTMAAAVLPMPSDVQIVINDKDVVVKTKRASGPGGQHVNKTESAVQIQHVPTGIIVESEEERSQMMNREMAMKKLRAQLYQIELSRQLSQHHSQRKLQFGTLGRAEKIRTYNFPQDRVTDHRLPLTVHGVASFLEGQEKLEEVIEKLLGESRKEALLDILESTK
ncbi:peptide chain release factor 1-like, mitochondrial [Ornithodoros turicata]|uniref:peptide chain release factor 1-like, mitochondrial n=1 Tax=Ornithodoros turicata TaxID=34597 RepID=UPI0031389DE0